MRPQYVSDQAPAVLKRVIAQFPYESPDNDEPCLRSETAVVSRYMANALQDRCAVAGVKIESFSINELSYAPEIAQSMLKRQQAGALIEARQVRALRLRPKRYTMCAEQSRLGTISRSPCTDKSSVHRFAVCLTL